MVCWYQTTKVTSSIPAPPRCAGRDVHGMMPRERRPPVAGVAPASGFADAGARAPLIAADIPPARRALAPKGAYRYFWRDLSAGGGNRSASPAGPGAPGGAVFPPPAPRGPPRPRGAL